MTFKISDLQAELDLYNGPLSKAHFYLQITTPRFYRGNASGIVRSIPILCQSAVLPGGQFGVQEISRYGYGINDKRPVGITMGSLPVSIIADAGGALFDFFIQWMQNIQNFNVRGQPSNTVNGMRQGEIAYPDNYETTIEVFAYDRSDTRVLRYVFDRAFPQSVMDTRVSWEDVDDVMKLDVDFTYRSWHSDSMVQSTGNSSGAAAARSLNYKILGKDSSVAPAHQNPYFTSQFA